MPTLRKDPVSGHGVIMAEDRANRPNQLCRVETRVDTVVCPFCEGQEDSTTPETLAFREPSSLPNSPGWRVRVVPNKYPALDGRTKNSTTVLPDNDPLFPTGSTTGIHEVFIECAEHLTSISQLSDAQMVEVVCAYRDRMCTVSQNRWIRSAIIFKNLGAAAGASLEHIHSQLMATSYVPVKLCEELINAERFLCQEKGCFFCQLVRRERETGVRVVLDTDHFLVICPFASRVPYEMCILPKKHASHFEKLSDSQITTLAYVLRQTEACLENILEEPAYNLFFHTAPFDMPTLEHYHWHVEILPRVTSTAGYEWGTGYYINPKLPEEAARSLRAGVVAARGKNFAPGKDG